MVLSRPRWDCDDRTMVAATVFDTHRFVNRLTGSGFTEKQAETVAEEHVTLVNANLSTKADIEALQRETRVAIEAVKADLSECLSGTQIVQGGLLLALASSCNAVHPFTV